MRVPVVSARLPDQGNPDGCRRNTAAGRIALTSFLAVVGCFPGNSTKFCRPGVRRCPVVSGRRLSAPRCLAPFDVHGESRTSGEVNFVKKIAVRKAGTVRLTAAASPLYGATCI